jgi:alkylation response protein AidB-like acyl-CoA dehydrogenase
MDLKFTEAEERFRREVRDFIAAELPEPMNGRASRRRRFEREHYLEWHRRIAAKGWIAPDWPAEWGGTGWTATEKYIYEEEIGLAGAPLPLPFGPKMLGPVLIAFGSEEQKKKYLPRIASGEDWWCQGYSEPGAGSDLASLKTNAVREGDEYVVTGQKIWTSYAHYATHIFALVRTSDAGKPQEGISFLLIDMKTPGIAVRPIVSIDLEHSVNETFFDNVRVPVENRVGEENKGWTYAKFLLGHERTSLAQIGDSKSRLRALKEIAARESAGGRPLIEDPVFRRRLAEIELRLMALEFTLFRYLAAEESGGDVGAVASLAKIKGTELTQAITEATLEAVGTYGLPYISELLDFGSNTEPVGPDYAAAAMPNYLYARALTILGGSNEIQRNIIAKQVLGL